MIAKKRTHSQILRRLLSNNHGVAMIEFAFVGPVMITLYLGTFQLCDAISAYRKVTTTARSIADLTSQYISVSNADLDTVLNSSTQIMAPYSALKAKMTVTQIKIDNSGAAKVDWSRSKNAIALNGGDDYALPSAIKTPNSSLIIAKVTYEYTPPFAFGVIGSIPFSDTIMMSPRAVVSVSMKAN
jgi:Flp pilus assembly protein TadG